MKLEAGQAGGLTLNGIAAVFQGLGGRIDLRPMWQGAALDRLLDEGHARLSGRMLEILGREGWATELEVTFSVYGDRGSIDILAWHAASRTLLVVEIKTELGSVEGLLRPLDVKCRLARHRTGPLQLAARPGRPVGDHAGGLDRPASSQQTRAHRRCLPPAPLPRGAPVAAIAPRTAGGAVVPVRSAFHEPNAEPVSRSADPAGHATLTWAHLSRGQPAAGPCRTSKVPLHEHLTAERQSRGRKVCLHEHLTDEHDGRSLERVYCGASRRGLRPEASVDSDGASR